MSLILSSLKDRGRSLLLEPGRLHNAIAFSRTGIKTVLGPTNALQTVATGVPGYQYNPDGSFAGLLMEYTATNVLLNTDAPVTQSYTTTASVYTLSFYGTGSVALSGAFAATVTGTGLTTRTVSTFTSTAAALTLTISGTVTDIQLEIGKVATSYISNAGAANTRNNDAATIASLPAINYSATAGTLVVVGTVPTLNGTNFNSFAEFSDGTASNRIQAYLGASGLTFFVFAAAVTQAQIAGANPAAGTVFKMAMAWQANDFALYTNGTLAGTDTVGTIPTCTQFDIGKQADVTNRSASAPLKSITYYPSRLPNTFLAAAST